MKLYIAGPWKHREEVGRVADQFIAAGHQITERWWEHEEVDLSKPGGVKEMGRQAKLDERGVMAADQFVFLNLAYSEGKCVELGIAISEGIPITAVGHPAINVFHYHPSVKWVETAEEVVVKLSRQQTL